ncbi:SDR family oxidoreductase [Stagnimonas aquatica]|uniref:SDR family oxidoreductase n=1 Tax=Stagnimonas aquatica TaxID=2689987 RepID=A0A3N0V7I9_9GAMM|nr:SDR family oxidoreductase [Stagnimonas aquatica]ROH88760.1 SDR family oxidoreductase [Stagnimonas aquatica]
MTQTALITGASSGIGAAFARALARRGDHLILVARSKDKLEALAASLRAEQGATVSVIPADLGLPECGRRLAAEVAGQGLSVDLLINNAGFGAAGAFATQDPVRDAEMIQLNVAAVVDLAHAFLPGMLERGHGGIVNVASVAGFQPMPQMAIYAATKAFVLSFSEALWVETRGRGVQVTALCPGPVDTPFFEATGSPQLRKAVPKGLMMAAETVAAQALAALAAGRPVVVPGGANKLLSAVPRLLPRRWVALASGLVMNR